MNRIEDELRDAAAELRQSTSDVDVDGALERVLASDRRRTRRVPLIAAAAAAVVVVLVASAVLWWPASGTDVVADRPDESVTTTSPESSAVRSTDVTGELLSTLPAGWLLAATEPDALADQLLVVDQFADPDTIASTVAGVDFDEWVVVGMTVSREFGCPNAPTSFELDGDDVTVAFGSGPITDCLTDLAPRGFFVALSLADLPDAFTLVLPPPYSATDGPGTLDVDLSRASATAYADADPTTTTSIDPTVPTTPPSIPLPVDDLRDAPPGREITFEGIGDVQLGQVVPPERVSSDFAQSGCGYWPDGEVVQSADAPPTALVGGADTAEPRVTAVYLRNNSSYRTASGIGIGTSLATLQRIYGDRLVVDEVDGWEFPTDGLLASYQPVAAVSDGDRAITYTLTAPVDAARSRVEAVKVSAADFWGDDEGCA
jgi:hypothetical protein